MRRRVMIQEMSMPMMMGMVEEFCSLEGVSMMGDGCVAD
jgi:hypothetical protein